MDRSGEVRQATLGTLRTGWAGHGVERGRRKSRWSVRGLSDYFSDATSGAGIGSPNKNPVTPIMDLREELPKVDCTLTPDEFRELIKTTYKKMHPFLPCEQLGFYPDLAKRFCGVIRHQANAPMLEDHITMKTLTNIRKNSQMGKTT